MNNYNQNILLAISAQVGLTFIVWCWMYYTRIGTMFRKGIKSQQLEDAATFDVLLKDVVNPSDNLENLFEMPVLFYAAMIVILFMGTADVLFGYLAWGFVALRVIHSFIHCTSNVINARFTAYFVSSLILWATWARIGMQLLQ